MSYLRQTTSRAPNPGESGAHERVAGFTLMEVLVTVGILMILTGLLLPIYLSSRGASQATACVSNLRQLHGAFMMYGADHGDLLPPYCNKGGWWAGGPADHSSRGTPVPEQGQELFDAMSPYVSARDLWFCPADPGARKFRAGENFRRDLFSYRTGSASGWHALGMAVLTTTSLSVSRRSSDQILLLTDNSFFAQSGFVPPPSFTHAEGFNYLYLDGHVRHYRLSNPAGGGI